MSHASPDPFALAGGPVTVILLHGFTGSPAEMRLLAHALNARGYGVETPLLAGHGTRLDDLMKIEPHQWLEQIDALVQRLHDQGQRVVVAGLSLGSILALQAGLRHPEVEAVMAYSPPIISGDPRVLIAPLLARVLPSVARPAEDFVDPATVERIWAYDRWPSRCSVRVLGLIRATRRQLAGLQQPLLVVASRKDRVITERGVEWLRRRVGSRRVVLHWLDNSGHVITADAQWRLVADQTLTFLERL